MDANFAHLFTGIERVLSQHAYTASLYISAEIAPKENQILDEVRRHKMDGVILATCQPGAVAVFHQLKATGMPMVFVEREPTPGDFSFVGYNHGSSLEQILEKWLAKGIRKIGLISGPPEYSSERDCISVWHDVLKRHGVSPEPHFHGVTNFDKESSFKVAIRLIQSANLPEVLIATSTQILEGILKALELAVFPTALRPELICLGEASWSDHSYPQVLWMDRQSIRLGELAAETLLAHLEDPAFSESRRSLLKNVDRVGPFSTKRKTSGRKVLLRAAMLKGEALEATGQLLGDFTRKAGTEVELEGFEYTELWATINDGRRRKDFDILEIDIPWLEEFARAGYLQSLEGMSGEHPGAFDHFIPGVLDAWSLVDNVCFGFPYKFDTQVLFYRKDLFEDPVLKRGFFELHKAELRPPRNWREFNTVARFFTRSFHPESPVEWGTTLGAKDFSGAVCEFLPRKWAYENAGTTKGALHAVNNRETLRALHIYLESFSYANPGSPDYWWDEQVDAFAAGKAAMMIMFVAHATKLTNRLHSRVLGKIDFAPVPGHAPVLGGWSLAINKDSPFADSAFDFMRWITGSDIAIPHTILGGATPSVELYKSSELVGIYPWLPRALESFALSRRRTPLVLPGGEIVSEQALERVLGEEIHSCVVREKTPEQAVANVDERIAWLRELAVRNNRGGLV